MEIERKFIFPEKNVLLTNAFAETGSPLGGKLPLTARRIIYTHYAMHSENLEMRIGRRSTIESVDQAPKERYVMTIKSVGGLSRTEIERDLTRDEYHELYELMRRERKKPIVKNFFLYRLSERMELELSYVDHEWWYAEVEFPSEDAAKRFKIPSALKPFDPVEVTDDPYYKMKNYWIRTRERMDNDVSAVESEGA